MAFAFAMVVVLAGAGLFVYVRLRTDFDERIVAGLDNRADAAAMRAVAGDRPALVVSGAGGFGEPIESFAQLLSTDGRVLATAGGPDAPAATVAERARSAIEDVVAERRVDRVDGTARILVRTMMTRDGPAVLVVGESLDDRDEALSEIVRSFVLGVPVAVVVASALGYALATAGFRPVEAMRRRANEIALDDGDAWLPLPAAGDEMRRLGETLNIMLARLRASVETERRFVADASHELRTPVAIIKTELENALRSGNGSPEGREALLAAVEECDSLAQLADDLLVVARASDGGLPVRGERLAVAELLDAVKARFEDRASFHLRAIRVEASDDLSVNADPMRLRQALGNLVDNALRHGAGDVMLGARPSGAGIELTVTDDGTGFAPDIADRAFERFTRDDRARSGTGAGLGLAIVRVIAEAHGGTAQLDPGGGSTVRLWLPAAGFGPLAGAGPSHRHLR